MVDALDLGSSSGNRVGVQISPLAPMHSTFNAFPNHTRIDKKTGKVAELSRDHDLGDDDRGTGYDVVVWIEEQVATAGFSPPDIKVHSANSSARQKMERGIESIERLVSHVGRDT